MGSNEARALGCPTEASLGVHLSTAMRHHAPYDRASWAKQGTASAQSSYGPVTKQEDERAALIGLLIGLGQREVGMRDVGARPGGRSLPAPLAAKAQGCGRQACTARAQGTVFEKGVCACCVKGGGWVGWGGGGGRGGGTHVQAVPGGASEVGKRWGWGRGGGG